MQETQIATHDQIKVRVRIEVSRKITGLLLFNGFVNTSAVDMAATPTVAVPGSGSTGASVRQTVLGVDARGPHLFGARSYADLRVDFDGNATNSVTAATFGSYATNDSFLRLQDRARRLQWEQTEAYFSLRPSDPQPRLTLFTHRGGRSCARMVWQPMGLEPAALAYPNVPFAESHALRLQAALIDVGDPPVSAR